MRQIRTRIALTTSLLLVASAASATGYYYADTAYSTPTIDNADFGLAVAISGNRMVVGAPNAACPAPSTATGCGSAYVFGRVDGRWVQQAALTATTPSNQAGFGSAVAIDGDWVLVGAPLETRAGQYAAGNVYLYHFVNDAWTPVALTTPLEASSELGYAVALSATGIAVAGMSSEVGTGGAVATFVADAQGDWNYEGLLREGNGGAGDGFGAALGLYTLTDQFGLVLNYTLAIGAPGASVLGNAGAGEGYVFARTPSNTGWILQNFYSLTTTAHANEQFGYSASVYGGVAAFGVPARTPDGSHYPGSVYVVRRNGGDWADYTAVELASPQPSGQTFFGWSVALHKNTLFVGAPHSLVTTVLPLQVQQNAGAGYQFDYAAPNWTQNGGALIAPNASQGAAFGYAAAFEGNLAVFGALGALSPDGTTLSGAAYTFQPNDIFADGFE